MTRPAHILQFAEDPGAANFIGPVHLWLVEQGERSELVATGNAQAQFDQLGVRYVPLDGDLIRHFEVTPKMVVVGTSENPDSAAFCLIEMARQRGVATAAVVDSPINAEYRFRGRGRTALHHAPDLILVPDVFSRDRYLTLGLPGSRVCVTGHPHHDLLHSFAEASSAAAPGDSRRAIFPLVPDSRRIIVFATELSDGLNTDLYRATQEYSLSGWGVSSGRTEIVLEEFLDAVAALPSLAPYLVLRLHPKNSAAEFERYLNRFDAVSQGDTPLQLLSAADLVVGLTSTLLQEAVLLGTPTLSILPRRQEGVWLPTIGMGLTPHVTRREAIPSALVRALSMGRDHASERLCRLFSKGATERAGMTLLALANQGLRESTR